MRWDARGMDPSVVEAPVVGGEGEDGFDILGLEHCPQDFQLEIWPLLETESI